MGHHIDPDGRFRSDKHPDLPPDRIRLSFERRESWRALWALAEDYEAVDPELSADIRARLEALGFDPPQRWRIVSDGDHRLYLCPAALRDQASEGLEAVVAWWESDMCGPAPDDPDCVTEIEGVGGLSFLDPRVEP